MSNENFVKKDCDSEFKNIRNYSNYPCNHNINDINNTLKPLKVTKMIYPPKFQYMCTCCKSFFTFQKDEKGNLVLEQ